MNYIDGSLNCVINGDWNRRYIQPDYIGQTVFGVQEMDIQISGLGSDSFGIIFHSGKIRVLPRQDRVQFIADDFEEETIARFEEVHISFEGREINTTERMKDDSVSIEFNEHHSGENIREEIQTEGSIKDFLTRTEKIVKAMYPETGDD